MSLETEGSKPNLDDVPEGSNGSGFPLEGNLEEIEINPNYRGNWTELLFYRISSNRNKLISLIKSRNDNTNIDSVLETFDSLTGNSSLPASVFRSTEYLRSSERGRKPHQVGVGSFGKTGTVFTDATNALNGTDLDSFQKNIAESHEKAHGIFNMYNNDEYLDIINTFDISAIPEEKGLRKYHDDLLAYEYMARMSQLKNYFGFKADEEFTKGHLDYARRNYIKDTGWDNNMSDFFKVITPEKEIKFLELINKLPC